MQLVTVFTAFNSAYEEAFGVRREDMLGKIVLDLAVAVALGGDAACDVAVLRAQPGVFGLVASDPTVS